MYKKKITYEDFDGTTVTDDLYFNLTQAELVEMEMSTKNGFTNLAQYAIAETDRQQIFEIIKNIVLKSYGIRRTTMDGKQRFVKTPEITNDFLYSAAYNAIIIDLFTDEKHMIEFLQNIVPASLRDNSNIASEKIENIKTKLADGDNDAAIKMLKDLNKDG